MKVLVNRAFTTFFWSQKEREIANRLCIKFSLTVNISVQKCLYISLISTPFFPAGPCFSNISNRQFRIKKTNILWVTTLVFQDWPQNTSSHTCMDSLDFYLTPEYLLNFLSNLHIPPLLEKIVFKLTVSKECIYLFLLIPPKRNSTPGSYYQPPRRGRLWISPREWFLKIYSSQRKGAGGRRESGNCERAKKVTKTKLVGY